MNEIPELTRDIAFLKKFDSRSNIWKEINGVADKSCANFLLHPKRFSSESECSTATNSPRHFFSGTQIRNSSADNNVQNRVRLNLPQSSRTVTLEACRVEKTIGDCHAAHNDDKQTKKVKKIPRIRPASCRNDNLDKKFMVLVERSIKLLSNIRVTIEEGIAPPDGEEDFTRRMKRLQEFTSRFSRVYLYPLLRQMDELSMPEKLGTVVVNQKLLCAQQIVLQGLQAYHTHLPSSVGKCGSDKLRSLLEQILYLCHLHGLLKKGVDDDNEFINAMRNHTELLLEAVNHFDFKFTEKKPKQNEGAKKKCKSNKTKSKLSMYTESQSFKKDLELKRAVEALAKKKFSVKSKYKTAGFKHRPPVERQKVANVPSKIRIFPKNSSGLLKSTPRKAAMPEDDIKTMVEMESELQAPPNTGEMEHSIASSRQQLVQDNDQDDGGNVEKALEVLRKFLGGEKQTDFEKIISEVDKRREALPVRKKPKEPVVTVTGASNARLICIRDDNSPIDDFKQDKEMMTDAEVRVASSETQTDVRRSRSRVKISRLPKTARKGLRLLPKEYAVNVIQYKLRYNHFHKHNPMYRKSAHIQPWVLMGQISDEILDHILQSVTRELEVNEILENLYNAEFQY